MKLKYFIIFSLFAQAGYSQNTTAPQAPVDTSAYNELLNTPYSLFIHKRTYILPAVYNWATHDDIYSSLPGFVKRDKPYYDNLEAEFQISFFIPIYRDLFHSKWDLLAAYTHHSWWQLYNSAWSKPFRETNYQPELFVRRVDENPIQILQFNVAAYDLGYVHNSNGQIQELSRSWNKLFARAYLLNDNISFSLEAWLRLPEKEGDDDNTNIQNYMGIGEAVIHKSIGSHSLEVKFPFATKPGIEVMYSYPWREHLRWFVTGRSGYGHSLIEYDKKTERIGVGITLESLMDTHDSRRTSNQPLPVTPVSN